MQEWKKQELRKEILILKTMIWRKRKKTSKIINFGNDSLNENFIPLKMLPDIWHHPRS
jgi:hypothetical protein